MRILYLHGWHSVPGGVKPTYLAKHGHEVIDPKLPDDDFAAAVQIGQAEFDRHHPDVVVGSSRGGAVAMNMSSGDTRLVLLCPAWKKYGAARSVKMNTTILHSRADDVVPIADSEELVKSSSLPAAALVEVGNDHRLADPEPLAAMLRACAGRRNPTIRRLAEGRTIAVVGDVYRFLATGEDTDGKYALWEAIVPPGGGPPPHVHSREEEGFFILEGEITIFIGDQRLVASAGMFANMPVGTPHSFKNESGKSAKMLISIAPAGLEKMFLEIGAVVPQGTSTAAPPTKDEIDRLVAAAHRYGIEIKLPGR
jgi:mannose-6-phosphate isomerase-like protein (cupin superfamily)